MFWYKIHPVVQSTLTGFTESKNKLSQAVSKQQWQEIKLLDVWGKTVTQKSCLATIDMCIRENDDLKDLIRIHLCLKTCLIFTFFFLITNSSS